MGRYRDRTAHSQDTSPHSAAGEVELYSPVAKRVKQAIEYMATSTIKASDEHKTPLRIVSKIASAALDDFAEVPQEVSAFYLHQLALMIEWCGTGEWKSDSIPFPEGLNGSTH
jgi:hypothetical protein